ncbi:ChbG/HpnK family deacetylase [Streptococcus suis]|nr:ChbG/HpnK family deacetylase [Streptococcus suis]
MTKKLLFRADDLGYSEAVNYGIEKTIKDGLIKSVGVMVNMPATDHGVQLIKGYDIAVGLHTNICAETPLTDPSLIPSLVDEKGRFKTSQEFRESKEDFVVFEEVVLEIEAQYHKFVELLGRQPDYFEGHAVMSANFFKGLEYVAQKYNLKYSGFSMDGQPILIGNSQVKITLEAMSPHYDPFDMVKRIVHSSQEDCVQLIIFHPGYIDNYLMTNSSLTIPRIKEVEFLTSPQSTQWLSQQAVELLDYRNL